jgi:hypothetical protein
MTTKAKRMTLVAISFSDFHTDPVVLILFLPFLVVISAADLSLDDRPDVSVTGTAGAAVGRHGDAHVLAEEDFEDDSLSIGAYAVGSSSDSIGAGVGAGGVVRSRKYDLSITYDNYYRTPRIWLFGYDESGSALEPSRVFEDIMSDYAHKTVTLEPHPHMPTHV